MSAEMALRITESAAKLGYTPNALTRSVFRGHSNLIGVVIGDIRSPFYLDLARGLESVATPSGCSVIFSNTQRDEDRERGQILGLESLRVQGLVITTQLASSTLTRSVAERGTNVVLVTQRMIDPPSNVCSIRLDNHRAGALAFEHLYFYGRRSFAIIAGSTNLVTQEERIAGIREVAATTGIEIPEACVRRLSVSDASSAYRATVDLFRGGRDRLSIDAIVCLSGAFLVGVVAALRDLNIQVPQDVGLVGFDKFPWASQLRPSLTLVTQPASRMGELAAEILTAERFGDLGLEHVFPPGIQVGESAGENL